MGEPTLEELENWFYRFLTGSHSESEFYRFKEYYLKAKGDVEKLKALMVMLRLLGFADEILDIK